MALGVDRCHCYTRLHLSQVELHTWCFPSSMLKSIGREIQEPGNQRTEKSLIHVSTSTPVSPNGWEECQREAEALHGGRGSFMWT